MLCKSKVSKRTSVTIAQHSHTSDRQQPRGLAHWLSKPWAVASGLITLAALIVAGVSSGGVQAARWNPAAKAIAPFSQAQQCGLIGPFEIPAAVGPTNNNDDFTLRRVTATTSQTTAGFINTLVNAGSTPGNFVLTAPTIPPGFTVIASLDSGASFQPLGSGGQLFTPTPVNPGEQRNIDVRVTLPSGLAVNTNYDIVLQVASATDPNCTNRTIDRVRLELPDLTISKSHSPTQFTRGKEGSFTLTVKNDGVDGTSGAVTVTDILPAGLQPTSADGTGWACTIASQTVTCTQGNVLGAGVSYSPITVKVNVTNTTADSVTNTATVAGGGETNTTNNSATDTVTVVNAPACTLVGPFENPAAVGPTDNNNDFTLRKINSALSLPPVGFVNTLTNTGSTPGNFVITAPTVPPGFTVIASIDSGATFQPLGSGGQLITPTPVNPGEQRNIDVRVSLPSGLAVNTDYDVVIQAASATDATCSNRTIDRVRLEPKPDPAPPNLSLVKSATDVNGGSLAPGDVIEYSLTLSNPSQAAVANAFIAEFIPANVTYVANSVRITSGANAGTKTDALRDDQVDYYGPTAGGNGQINIFVGTGAGSNRGGTLAPGESTTAVFRVTVNATLPCNTVIDNGADWGGDDFYAAGKSNVASVTVTCLPDVTISKTHSLSEFTRGREGSFTLTARNIGAAPTTGTLTVSDIVPAGLQPTQATGSGWSCSITGQTVTCTRSDALAAGSGFPPITVTVSVAGNAPAVISNTATVSGGGEANTANNSATDNVNVGNAPACALIGPFGAPAANGPTGNNDDFTARNVSFQLANGVTTVAGSVGFINTLTNTGGSPGQVIITAPVIPPGFTVRASIDSGMTFTVLNNGGMVITPTAVNPGEQRNLDVRVSAPAGLTVNTNYDVVIQAASADCTNRTIDRIKPDPVPDPNLTLVKSVVDLNGGAVLPGDTLEYSLTLSNPSSRSVPNTFISDFIPANVTYTPNSVRITSGAGSGPGTKTDAVGDDVVDYFAPQAGNNGQLNIFVGTGAAANAVASTDRERRGGTLAPGDSTTVTFRVTVNSNAACGATINNGAEWGGDLIFPGGKSNVASVVVCQATTCQTLCFHSAAFFTQSNVTLPNGSVLIGGVNGNAKVSTTSTSVRLALQGRFGSFIREHVAAQLNLLNASGIGAANVVTAMASPLSCYDLQFNEVALTGGTLSPTSSLFDLFQQAEAVAKRDASGATRDACVLAKIFNQLNGNSLSGYCNRTGGTVDFSSCPALP